MCGGEGGAAGVKEVVMRRRFCVLRQISKTIKTMTGIPKLNHSQNT